LVGRARTHTASQQLKYSSLYTENKARHESNRVSIKENIKYEIGVCVDNYV